MVPDLATRVYNHTFRIDPIVRTLLDTDFYKLLMLQMIWRLHRKRRVTFQLINRTPRCGSPTSIEERELIDQLDHARSLRLAKNELIWLAGNTFYGTRQIFEPAFMEWLAGLPAARLRTDRRDGQYELRFEGLWAETTMWEIPALAIINELRARAAMRGMSRFDLDVLYARAKAKLWSKVERLRVLKREGPLRISDFGTRRRHGFLWQRWCVEAMQEGLGDTFIGTSNVKHAMDTGLEAIGTNAHELPMVYAALADDRRGVARRALQRAARLGGDVRRQPARRAARLLRHHLVPRARARLGRRLEGRAAGFEIAARRRARTDRVVARARPRSPRKADRAVGRDGRRFHREPPRARCAARSISRSAGAPTSPTTSRAARRPGSTANSPRSRWSAKWSRRTGGRR